MEQPKTYRGEQIDANKKYRVYTLRVTTKQGRSLSATINNRARNYTPRSATSALLGAFVNNGHEVATYELICMD